MWVADKLVIIGMATMSLGVIHEKDGPRRTEFRVKNTGDRPETMVQGYTSCGCTTLTFDKAQPVPPGDSTRIVLSFDPTGRGGDFYESGTIVYGTDRERLQVAIEGTCVTSEMTLMRQFPIRLSDELRLSTDRFDLGVMAPGEKREVNVVVLHREDNDRREIVTVTVRAESATMGVHRQRHVFRTKVNGREQEIAIVTTYRVDVSRK